MSIGLALLFGSWRGAWVAPSDTVDSHVQPSLQPDMARALKRWPGLLPDDPSPEAISRWHAATCPETVLSEDDIETLVELVQRGRRYAVAALVAPMPEEPQREPIEIDVAPPPRGALSPVDAAKLFLRWLRAHDHSGPVLAEQLSTLYAEHCSDLGIQPLFYATLRKELIRLPGVDRRVVNINASSRDGKRQRPRVWYFGEPAGEEECQPPWSDLPMRAA